MTASHAGAPAALVPENELEMNEGESALLTLEELGENTAPAAVPAEVPAEVPAQKM